VVTWDSFEPRRRPKGGGETTEQGEVHPTPSAVEVPGGLSGVARIDARPEAPRRLSLGAWLSPVERCVRDAEVPGSNPGAPIVFRRPACWCDRISEDREATAGTSGRPDQWAAIAALPGFRTGLNRGFKPRSLRVGRRCFHI
jgi:hypothetical protein